ncbi:MAG: transporter substrate-binding domain-containing protein [Bacteroidales bacterium]|nr:transporter substrate-binding domain-containing protein [Bacteroidales bacterium]
MVKKFFFLLLVGMLYFSCQNSNNENLNKDKNHSVYDRVIHSKVIRASYIPYPPYCIIDPNTKKLSGIFVEVLEEIGKKTNLKIKWVEEVGWGTVFEGLNNDRYDIHGSGLWVNSTRGMNGYFSDPLFYNPIMVWARLGDKRFDNKLFAINDSKVRIAVQDGAMEDIIAKSDFPNATRISITQTNPWSDNLLNIITKKADITFAEPWVIYPFLKKNPGTIYQVSSKEPIRYFANSYVMKMGEDEFKSMINAALNEIIMEGTMNKILSKYENTKGEFLRVVLPFQK